MELDYHFTIQPYFSKKAYYDVNLEDALNIVGFGRHQWAFAVIAGLAFHAAGVQNGITAFILPSMKCDMGLTSSQMGLLNAVFLLGGIGAGIVWGSVVDSVGRKPVLYYGLLIDCIVTLASSFSPNFYVFLVFRFLNGFIIGGPASIALVHVGEVLPQNVRSAALCYIGLSWAVSWVVTAGLAWVIIPMEISWELIPGLEFTSWRLLLAVVAAIDLGSAMAYSATFESPKFHLSKGRGDLALIVLGDIYAQNTGMSPSDFPVKSLQPLKSSCSTTVNCSNKSVWRPLVVTLKKFRALLHGPALGATALSCFLWFTNMFGYYGLGLWMPELANRYKTYEASNFTGAISVCELSGLQVSSEASCSNSVDPSVFTNTLISGGSLVMGNIAAALLAARLPRRFMPVFFAFGAALCVMALFVIRTSTENLVVSSVFQLCIGTANLVQNVLVVDIFPAEISGLAICIAIMMGRVGAMISNIVLGQLLDISCSVPIVMCAVFIGAGGVAGMFLPKPYQESTPKPKQEPVITISRNVV